MSDLAARLAARSSALPGIQPRINPITAPDPWQGPLDLELAELETIVEASPSVAPARPAAPRQSLAALPQPPASPPARAPMHERDVVHEQTSQLEVQRQASVAAIPTLRSTIDPLAVEASRAEPARARDGAALDEQVEQVERGLARPSVEPSTSVRGPSGEAPASLARSLRANPLAFTLPSLHARAPVHELGGRDEATLPLEVHDLHDPDDPRGEQRAAARGEPLGGRGSASSLAAHETSPGARAPRSELDTPAASTSTSTARSGPRPRSGPGEALEALDTPLRAPRREAAREPVVRVEIGRVELRSPPSREPQVERGIPKPTTFVSLDQYLRERGKS